MVRSASELRGVSRAQVQRMLDAKRPPAFASVNSPGGGGGIAIVQARVESFAATAGIANCRLVGADGRIDNSQATVQVLIRVYDAVGSVGNTLLTGKIFAPPLQVGEIIDVVQRSVFYRSPVNIPNPLPTPFSGYVSLDSYEISECQA